MLDLDVDILGQVVLAVLTLIDARHEGAIVEADDARDAVVSGVVLSWRPDEAALQDDAVAVHCGQCLGGEGLPTRAEADGVELDLQLVALPGLVCDVGYDPELGAAGELCAAAYGCEGDERMVLDGPDGEEAPRATWVEAVEVICGIELELLDVAERRRPREVELQLVERQGLPQAEVEAENRLILAAAYEGGVIHVLAVAGHLGVLDLRAEADELGRVASRCVGDLAGPCLIAVEVEGRHEPWGACGDALGASIALDLLGAKGTLVEADIVELAAEEGRRLARSTSRT